MSKQNEVIHVVAGAILDEHRRVLLSRRDDDAHQGGLWEFPGGKLEPGETIGQGLRRELQEELGIIVTASRPLLKITHHYHDLSVCLDVHTVTDFEGQPEGLEGQPLRWCHVETLDPDEFPAADVPVINALRLPDRYLITGKFDSIADFQNRLDRSLANGIKLVQLRIKPDWYRQNSKAFESIVSIAKQACASTGAILMMNVPEEADARVAKIMAVKTLHADSRRLQQLDARPDCEWFSASCHTAKDLDKAQSLGADFVVLSPVQYTTSHPDTEPLGWPCFATMIEDVNIPVYALGGVDASHVDRAIEAGGQGVAAISAFWS